MTLELIDVISADRVDRAQGLVALYYHMTGQTGNLRMRIAQFALAAKELGGDKEAELATAMWAAFGVGDPAEFILNEIAQLGKVG